MCHFQSSGSMLPKAALIPPYIKGKSQNFKYLAQTKNIIIEKTLNINIPQHYIV